MRKERPGPGAHIAAQLRALNDSAGDKLLADARALWAVRVLDAWADMPRGDKSGEEWQTLDHHMGAKSFKCYLTGDGGQHWYGATRDAARLAAAEAVWPELPADVRAKLGERP